MAFPLAGKMRNITQTKAAQGSGTTHYERPIRDKLFGKAYRTPEDNYASNRSHEKANRELGENAMENRLPG